MSAIPANIRLVNMNSGNNPDVIRPTLINAYSVEGITAWNRAITFLAENLASFPRSVHLDGAKAKDQDVNHPIDDVLMLAPNGYQNSFVLFRTWVDHAASSGNGYLRISRRMAVPTLHNMLPHDVLPFRYTPENTDEPEQYYLHRPTGTVYPGADVLHLQARGYDGMSGADPVERHSATFQLAATLSKYQTYYLRKGTVIRGAIEIPGSIDDDRLQQYAQYIKDHFYGIDADRDVIILTDGGKLNNATVSPQESQVIQQGASITKQIAQITGVPPEFLYELSEAKYNASVELAGNYVVRYTFRPWITQAEQEMTLKLLTPAERQRRYRIRINPDALLRGDTAAVTANVKATVDAGVRTPNEGRSVLDLPRIEDPEADRLKRSGDTTPATQKTEVKPE